LKDKRNRNNGKKTNEFSNFQKSKDSSKFKESMHDKTTRRTVIYVLIGAFVTAVFGCMTYSMITNNNELTKYAFFTLLSVMMLGISHLFKE
jgi:hypothetical protein